MNDIKSGTIRLPSNNLDHMTNSGVETMQSPGSASHGARTGGARHVGQTVLHGLSDLCNRYKSALDHTTGAIPGVGKVLTLTPALVAGGLSGLLEAGSHAVGGRMADAKHDLKQTASGMLSTLSTASAQASGVLNLVPLEVLPPQAKAVVVGGRVVAQAATSASNIGHTALNGGDVGRAVGAGVKDLGSAALLAAADLAVPVPVASSVATTEASALVGASKVRV